MVKLFNSQSLPNLSRSAALRRNGEVTLSAKWKRNAERPERHTDEDRRHEMEMGAKTHLSF